MVSVCLLCAYAPAPAELAIAWICLGDAESDIAVRPV